MGHSQLNQTLTTQELAARVGVHEKTIRRQCLAGAIPARLAYRTDVATNLAPRS